MMDGLAYTVHKTWKAIEARCGMRENLTKSDWLIAQGCLSQAWFGLRQESSAPDEAGRFRMEQGREVGKLAHELFQDGVLVTRQGVKSATDVTTELVQEQTVSTLFEAAFTSGRYVARADILKREHGGWHVLEVKSSFSDTKSMTELVADLAYTVFVLRRAGLSVQKASLLLLSRGFQHGHAADRLFETVDKTTEANVLAAKFETEADLFATSLFADDQPLAALLSACRDCDFFAGDCLGLNVAHSVLELPGLHHTKLKRLSAAGVIDMAHLPSDIGLNERQERARAAAVLGVLSIKGGLAAALGSIQWPCSYLDFETVATVLPAYAEHGCHRQVLTQFSIHTRAAKGLEPGHSEYLADARQDCERVLAEALIRDLGATGSVIVYSTFEKTRIAGLRDAFPDLAAALQDILNRLIDLLPIIQDHVYHPEFRGSFSIKKVLPALVPALSYEGLAIANGDTAIARFAQMARGRMSDEEVAATRQHLLDYCKLDTLAMLQLHETLWQLASGGQPLTMA